MTVNASKYSKAILYTLGIHSLLLFIFFLVKYQTVAVPIPTIENPELVELEAVALGTDLDGFGIEPPEMVMGMPAPPNATSGESAPTKGNNDIANYSEVDQEDDKHDDVEATIHPSSAPVLKKSGSTTNPKPITATTNKNTNKKASNNITTQTVSTKSTNKPAAGKYTYDGSNGPGGNGADQNAAGAQNRGDGIGSGIKGKPGGDPNSLNFTGDINGRRIRVYPNNKAEFRDGGKVTIKVWINREGEITNHKIQSATNSTIQAIAVQKLKEIRFTKKPDANPTESGIIVINFKAGSGK